MGLEQVKDYMLASLLSRDVSLQEWTEKSGFSEAQLEASLEELVDTGYVKIWSESGWGTYTITSSGRVFLEHNSFGSISKQKFELEENELKKQNLHEKRGVKDEIRKNATLFFACTTVLLSIWNFNIQNTNSNIKEKNEDEIKSIKENVSRLKLEIDSLSKIMKIDRTKKNIVE
jgi:hypothetical protein